MMKRTMLLAAAAAATLFTATAANASRVNWSIGINVPPVATVVSSGRGYYAQPCIRRPRTTARPATTTTRQPTYYEPAYAPAPVYYAPPSSTRRARVTGSRRGHRHWRGGHDRWHHSRHGDWRAEAF